MLDSVNQTGSFKQTGLSKHQNLEDEDINNRDSFPTIHNISSFYQEQIDVNKDFLPQNVVQRLTSPKKTKMINQNSLQTNPSNPFVESFGELGTIGNQPLQF